MKIDFARLIEISGKEVTKADVARELTKQGFYLGSGVAYNAMQQFERGERKVITIELLQFLLEYFDITYDQFISK